MLFRSVAGDVVKGRGDPGGDFFGDILTTAVVSPGAELFAKSSAPFRVELVVLVVVVVTPASLSLPYDDLDDQSLLNSFSSIYPTSILYYRPSRAIIKSTKLSLDYS